MRLGDLAALGTGERGEAMREPDEVAAMVRLHALGWGVRRIAAELGCSHMRPAEPSYAGTWVTP